MKLTDVTTNARPHILGLATLLFATTVFAQSAPVPVFVYEVDSRPFVNEIEALGTLKANQNVVLTSTVTEYVTAIHFEDGQRVQSGELLVEMDATEELAIKQEEQARSSEAGRQVDRLTRLSNSGATSASTLDAQKLDLQTSQARIKAIDSQIRQRQIVAPFGGILGQRDISIGTLVQPGTLITTIDDDSIMKLDFAVPEVFLSAIEAGVEIEASTKVWPEVFQGKVASISSRVDPVTRSIMVRALINNEDKKLRPGMLMRVQLQSNPRNTLVIPEESVITQGRKQFVYTINENADATSVNLAPVSLGVRRKGEVEILDGLSAGDRVVTHGISRVRQGTRVVIKARDDGNTELRVLLNQPSS